MSCWPNVTDRTSRSHPLRIAEVAAGAEGGLVGITFCPGKSGHSERGTPWERDLATDLDAIARWQADAVVTLIENHEFDLLGVPDLGAQVRARGMAWHHLPIVDVQPPAARFETGWQAIGPGLLERLRRGGRVLVHCRGGLGRSGTVAALMLIELGEQTEEAVRRVRSARPGAIETPAQLRYLLEWQRRDSACK